MKNIWTKMACCMGLCAILPLGVQASISRSTTYWPSGDLKTQTDENGLTTSYAYSVDGSGRRVETVTRPDGSTEITTYHLDGQIKSRTGTGIVAEYHAYTVASSGNIAHRIFVGSGTSPRYSETTTDWLGRTMVEERPAYTGTWTGSSTYDATSGRLIAQTRTGLADVLFEYDELGRQTRQGVDINDNGTLNEASTDVTTEDVRDYTQVSSNWYARNTRKQWLTDGSGTGTTIQVSKNQISGLSSTTLSHEILTDIYGNDTDTVITVNRSTATVTTTTNVPGSSIDIVHVTVGGKLDSANTSTVAAASEYTYDEYGRLETATDPTGFTVTYTYYPNTNRVKTIEPEVGAITEMTYKGQNTAGAGQVASKLTKEGGTTLSQIDYTYDGQGRLTEEGGSGTYSVTYGYDSTYGDRTTLETTRDGTTADVTTWIYQAATGLLTRKQYADAKGTDYTYYASGKLHTREWERGVTTTYSYDGAGNMENINYSDSTPDVSYIVSRAGRITAVTDAAGSHAMGYANDGQLTSDVVTGTGVLTGFGVSGTIGSYGRRSGFTAVVSSSTLASHAYTYSATTGRMATVSAGGHTATYGYKTNTDLLETTTFHNGTANVLTRTVTYDTAHRIDAVRTRKADSTLLSLHDYTVDSRSRRTRVDREDGAYWSYGYNNRNEVESGVMKFSDTTAIPGRSFAFAYDGIGNRENITLDGEVYDYGAANSVNQLTTREVPSDHVIAGSAVSAATVKVNDEVADRHGDFWSKVVTLDNGSTPAYKEISVKGTLAGAGLGGATVGAMESGHFLVPKTPESFVYDDDGNLTSDGLWTYNWDGENRLIAMESAIGVPAEAKRKLEFAYDHQGRRIRKKVYQWSGASYALQKTLVFVYDGWNLVAETDGAGALVRSYLWGLDMSGKEQGAGGVGGLLVFDDVATTLTCYVSADGNGNVTSLCHSTDATLMAEYVYAPFGCLLRTSSNLGTSNPFKWSSKYNDGETDFSYYGYRYYNPEVGRWVNRDPIDEAGGANLFAFVQNRAIDNLDYLGKFKISAEVRMRFPKFAKIVDTAALRLGSRGMQALRRWGMVCWPSMKQQPEAYAKFMQKSREYIGKGFAAGSGPEIIVGYPVGGTTTAEYLSEDQIVFNIFWVDVLEKGYLVNGENVIFGTLGHEFVHILEMYYSKDDKGLAKYTHIGSDETPVRPSVYEHAAKMFQWDYLGNSGLYELTRPYEEIKDKLVPPYRK